MRRRRAIKSHDPRAATLFRRARAVEPCSDSHNAKTGRILWRLSRSSRFVGRSATLSRLTMIRRTLTSLVPSGLLPRALSVFALATCTSACGSLPNWYVEEPAAAPPPPASATRGSRCLRAHLLRQQRRLLRRNRAPLLLRRAGSRLDSARVARLLGLRESLPTLRAGLPRVVSLAPCLSRRRRRSQLATVERRFASPLIATDDDVDRPAPASSRRACG